MNSFNEFINAFETHLHEPNAQKCLQNYPNFSVERKFSLKHQHERHCSRRRLAYHSICSVRCWSYCFYLGDSILANPSGLVGYSWRFEKERSTRLGDNFPGSSSRSTSDIRWICNWNVVDWSSGVRPTDSSCCNSRCFSGYRLFSPGYRPFQ